MKGEDAINLLLKKSIKLRCFKTFEIDYVIKWPEGIFQLPNYIVSAASIILAFHDRFSHPELRFSTCVWLSHPPPPLGNVPKTCLICFYRQLNNFSWLYFGSSLACKTFVVKTHAEFNCLFLYSHTVWNRWRATIHSDNK